MPKAKSQKSLDKWTDEKWGTSDGNRLRVKNATYQKKHGLAYLLQKRQQLTKLKLKETKKESSLLLSLRRLLKKLLSIGKQKLNEKKV